MITITKDIQLLIHQSKYYALVMKLFHDPLRITLQPKFGLLLMVEKHSSMDYELLNVDCAKEKRLLQGRKRDVHRQLAKEYNRKCKYQGAPETVYHFFKVKVAAVCHIQH